MYLFWKNQSLNNAINDFLKDQNEFSEELAQRFYLEYIADSEKKLSDIVQRELKTLLIKIIDIVKLSSQKLSLSDGSLEKIKERLAGYLPINELEQIVDHIKGEIGRLESNSYLIEEQLQQASSEIDQLKTKLEQYREEVFIDPLTQISNRRDFDTKINSFIEESHNHDKPLCLIMADIDHFKKFNDKYGHIVGDNILRVVAKTIKNSIKGKDLAARIGGEEFAVLLPATPINGAVTLAENIRSTFEQLDLKKRDTGEYLRKITLSFGVTSYIRDESIEKFINRADEALYQSKKSGRNKVTSFSGSVR